jgi:hypothetical protein
MKKNEVVGVRLKLADTPDLRAVDTIVKDVLQGGKFQAAIAESARGAGLALHVAAFTSGVSVSARELARAP